MKLQLRITFYFLTILLSGCSAANIAVMIPKAEAEIIEPVRSETIALVVDENFKAANYEVSQLLSRFQYDLGGYLPLAIADVLRSRFSSVDVLEQPPAPGQFDAVVTPELVSFDAPVPPTVFSRTHSSIRLKYYVSLRGMSEGIPLESTGSYELEGEDDEALYARTGRSGDDIYYDDPNLGTGVHMPNYVVNAGRDAYIAIHHCLYELNGQLEELFDSRH